MPASPQPTPERDHRLLVKAPPLPQRLSRRVNDHPGPSLFVAACAGFIVGRLLRWGWRSMRSP